MQKEMDFFYHCNVFDYILYFVIFLVEILYETLEYEVLDNIVRLYIVSFVI